MKYIVANWKMNLTLAEAEILAGACALLAEDLPGTRLIISPPLPFLLPIKDKLKFKPNNLALASQTVSPWEKGAYTGDVAAFQLKGIVEYAIIGHSERRRWHRDTEIIVSQIRRCLEVGITPIVCFGELHREGGGTHIIADLKRDLGDLSPDDVGQCLFAYEPVWAISSQKRATAATPKHIERVVNRLAEWFTMTYQTTPPILYGGSVTEDNASDLATVKPISGFLVGSASLHIKSFGAICRAFD